MIPANPTLNHRPGGFFRFSGPESRQIRRCLRLAAANPARLAAFFAPIPGESGGFSRQSRRAGERAANLVAEIRPVNAKKLRQPADFLRKTEHFEKSAISRKKVLAGLSPQA